MIKKVAAIQTSDGTLFLEPDEGRRHEFRWQLLQMFDIPEPEKEDAKILVDLSALVEKMEPLGRALREATDIVEGARAL